MQLLLQSACTAWACCVGITPYTCDVHGTQCRKHLLCTLCTAPGILQLARQQCLWCIVVRLQGCCQLSAHIVELCFSLSLPALEQ